ncbi:MAG: hypothetical protein H7066_17440 [Cytophagaceae bacterium]|nr:hypothetical protein [Gemmatimonadaceae bacterium]
MLRRTAADWKEVPMPMQVPIQNTGKPELIELPNVCPRCCHAMEPTVAATWMTRTQRVQVALRCGSRACGEMFLAEYDQGPGGRPWYLIRTVPENPERTVLPERVKQLSPEFASIFVQAEAAEALGLDRVAGGAYRKALEFLVSDYCVSVHPEALATIERMELSAVIQAYLPAGRVKECSQRSAWLKGDWTHYLKRWKPHDLADLKALIEVTVAWVQQELLAGHFLRSDGVAQPTKPALSR